MESEICIKRNKIKHISIVILSILVFFSCVIPIFILPLTYAIATKIILIVGALFSGRACVVRIKPIYKYPIILNVNSNGFIYHATSVSPGYVSWAEVTKIGICRIGNHTFIGVDVKNLNDLLKRLTSGQRRAVETNIPFGYPITINLGLSNENPHDICEQMREIWQHAIREQNDHKNEIESPTVSD